MQLTEVPTTSLMLVWILKRRYAEAMRVACTSATASLRHKPIACVSCMYRYRVVRMTMRLLQNFLMLASASHCLKARRTVDRFQHLRHSFMAVPTLKPSLQLRMYDCAAGWYSASN